MIGVRCGISGKMTLKRCQIEFVRGTTVRHSCQIRPQQATYNTPPINRPIEKFDRSFLLLSLSLCFAIFNTFSNFQLCKKLFIVVGKHVFPRALNSRWVHESFCYNTTVNSEIPWGRRCVFPQLRENLLWLPRKRLVLLELNQFSSFLVPLVHVMRL